MCFFLRKQLQIILLFLLSASTFLNAQESVVYSKKQANHFFKQANYAKAAEAYSQLIKDNNTNIKLNYKLGVSLFNSSKNKSVAIPYLKYAVENLNEKKGIEARFILALAYQLSYDFVNALKELEFLKASNFL